MQPTTKPSAHTEKQVRILREHALAYPESHEDFPWGHSAFKVRSKAFAFLHADADGFSISVKLPESNALALQLPFAEPTGYGLGKSGWISARFGKQDNAPLGMLKSWLEESYSAIAPKRLVKELFGAGGVHGESAAKAPVLKTGKSGATKALATPKEKAPAKKAPAKKAPAKKAPAKRPPLKKAPTKKAPTKWGAKVPPAKKPTAKKRSAR
jgi:predicted DNA-binding protein (MmcQ/YjbR family)